MTQQDIDALWGSVTSLSHIIKNLQDEVATDTWELNKFMKDLEEDCEMGMPMEDYELYKEKSDKLHDRNFRLKGKLESLQTAYSTLLMVYQREVEGYYDL